MNRRRLIALSAVMALVATGCSEKQPQNVLNPEGPVARQLDRLWDPVFIVAALIFFLVEGLVLFVAIRYRAKSDEDAPVQTHGNTVLEFGWTLIPFLLMVGVGIYTVVTLVDLDKRPTGSDVVKVEVIGHQWWWEYRYPDLDVVTANQLHIPAGRKIDIALMAEDVIHSWWPPALAGKVDAVPGRVNHMVIEADQAGKTYFGQCTEYCGLSHANMRIEVITHTDAEFAEWLRDQAAPAVIPTTGDAQLGADLFRVKGCGGCHAVKGFTAGEVGPDLTHFSSRTTFAGAMFDLTDQNLRRWLRDPPGIKPMDPDHGLGMPNLGLTEDEITKLMAFLEELT